MRIFEIGYEAAVAALRAIGDVCALASNEAAMYMPKELVERS